MRRVLLIALTAVAACSSATPTTTTTTTGGVAFAPERVAEALVEALAVGDYGATAELVDEPQLVFLAGAEGSTAGEAAAMLAGGVPPEVRANFWQSFVASVPGFSGAELTETEVGEPFVFQVEGHDFAALPVRFPAGGSSEWVARRDDTGRWRIDLLATFAGGFATPLRLWLEDLGEGVEADQVRTALEVHRPSLQAAAERATEADSPPGRSRELADLLGYVDSDDA